jgi:cysteine-S-conjugate beta-lyase
MSRFDTITDRRKTGSLKWDGLQSRYGVSGDDYLPLWVADMDFQAPPAVVQALVRRAEHGIYGYPSNLEAYREAICRWLLRRHEWRIQPEWIVSSPGVVSAVNLVIRAFTQRGDGVVIQPPVYFPFFRGVEDNGCRVLLNPLGWDGERYRIDFADLDQKLAEAKLLLLCSPHNPVGRVWSADELREVGVLCRKHDVLIISDEIHFDLVLPGHRHHVLAALSDDLAQRTIVSTSPSKTFNLAGLQPGYSVIPHAPLRRVFRRYVQACHIPEPNVFCLDGTIAAYTEGEAWLDELLGYLEGNLDFIEQFLAAELPVLKLIRPEGTYLAWVDCRALLGDPKALERKLLREAHVVFNQGYTFGPGGEGFIRINFACPRSLLAEALGRIVRLVRPS